MSEDELLESGDEEDDVEARSSSNDWVPGAVAQPCPRPGSG